ncbi:MAG: DNA-binding transcriptional regulator [Phycisphaeraceae bacterium]|nr:DNA-binding transcriptional regulator [Phycisphaeraceae bacterium]
MGGTLKTHRIRLIMEPDYGYCRDIVKGIRKFATHGSGWELFLSRMRDVDPQRTWATERCDGIIGLAGGGRTTEAMLSLDIPVVNVSSRAETLLFPSVIQDNHAIGHLAAEHLLERGFTRFTVVGFNSLRFSRERLEGFSDRIGPLDIPIRFIDRIRLEDFDEVRKLEPPMGVFVVTDSLAMRVIHRLIAADRRVPHDMAVIGVDNDDLLCDLAEVPLSSVDPGGERIGYEAAALLHRLIEGEQSPPTEPIRVPPAGVVERMSTQIMALEDPLLAKTMEYIQENACRRMTISDLVKDLEVSRRTLELRFKKRFGHTLHEEIRRVQMRLARSLLQDTDIPVPEVARRCGFSDYTRFISVFGAFVGNSPGRYRKQYRLTS